jgi:cyclohexyl-isocyanide hydratase
MTDKTDTGRRNLGLALGAAAVALSLPSAAQVPSPAAAPQPGTGSGKLQVAMMVHPNMILLDLVGAQTVFSIMGAEIHLVWKDRTPVRTDVGIPLTPTATFAECPADVDILFIPGGLGGSVAAMDDPEVLRFVADRGARARYVTSVCTGSLVLGAAGLLRGYRATSHWYVRDLLPRMGAVAVHERVVADRNRVTAGGVTAGLDFGLALAAMLTSPEDARRIQLLIEYDPQPPFHAGSPEGAGQELTQDVLKRRAPVLAAAATAADRAKERLGT